MAKTPLHRFWAWYERHYRLTVTLTAILFAFQLLHLYWMTAHVVMMRLTGVSYFPLSPGWELLLALVDYTEIPALISTSILYLHELHKEFRWRWVLYFLFLNIQWLHLFWITDEFVVDAFSPTPSTILPGWLAWIAILIDYLELPVIADTIRRSIGAVAKKVVPKKRASKKKR